MLSNTLWSFELIANINMLMFSRYRFYSLSTLAKHKVKLRQMNVIRYAGIYS